MLPQFNCFGTSLREKLVDEKILKEHLYIIALSWPMEVQDELH